MVDVSYSTPEDVTVESPDVRRAIGAKLKSGNPLERRLLAIGGERVELEPVYREYLAELGEKGVRSLMADMREYPTLGLTVVAGWPGACDMNTLPRWLNGEGDLVGGYSLRSADRTWWPNNWILRPDGTVLDSLPGHVAYFGKVCNEPSEWGSSWHDLLEAYRLANTPGLRPWIALVPAQ